MSITPSDEPTEAQAKDLGDADSQVHPPGVVRGLVLMAAAAAALLLDNSSLAWLYDRLLGMPLAITIGEFGLKKALLLWINDGLMAIFFLLVGLEIKREVLIGELSSRAKAALPLAAAVGGVAAPALVFVFLNNGQPKNLAG